MNKGDEYGTPLDFYRELDKRFHFKLDPCTTEANPLGTQFFFTKVDDGLKHCWSPGPVFMNFPYSEAKLWTRKAYEESLGGALVVGLARYDVSTRWWQQWVEGRALVIGVPFRIHFVGGEGGAYNFPSAICIWTGLFA